MNFLAIIAQQSNAASDVIKQIRIANTARHVQEIAQNSNLKGFFKKICIEVYEQMKRHSENKVELEVVLFDFEGSVLGRYPE
jgi:cobalt-precorrin-5B (C1)-methyltransferase